MAVGPGVNENENENENRILEAIRLGINMDIDAYRQSSWCERVFCGCFFGTKPAEKNALKVAFDVFVAEIAADHYVDFAQRLRSFVIENERYFYRGDQQRNIFAPILREAGLEGVIRGWDESRRVLLASPSTFD